MSKPLAKIGNMEIVREITTDIIVGDTVWAGKQFKPCGPQTPIRGVVVEECDDGTYDVRCSGAIVNVSHGEICAVDFTGE